MKTNKQYAYSSNNEMFMGERCDSIQEAIEKGKFELELKETDSIYVGEIVEIDKQWLKRYVCGIGVEQFQENMCMEIGNHGESWLDDLDEDNFSDYIAEYFIKNHKPGFFQVTNIKKYLDLQESDLEFSEE